MNQQMYEAMLGSQAKNNLIIDEVFLNKQSKVLPTEKGKELAINLMNARMAFIDSIMMSTPQGQEAFAKYKAGIESEYGDGKEQEIEELKAELSRLRGGTI